MDKQHRLLDTGLAQNGPGFGGVAIVPSFLSIASTKQLMLKSFLQNPADMGSHEWSQNAIKICLWCTWMFGILTKLWNLHVKSKRKPNYETFS